MLKQKEKNRHASAYISGSSLGRLPSTATDFLELDSAAVTVMHDPSLNSLDVPLARTMPDPVRRLVHALILQFKPKLARLTPDAMRLYCS